MSDRQVEPQRVIHRLLGQLSEAQLQAAQYAAMCDQLADQVAQLQAENAEPDVGGASA